MLTPAYLYTVSDEVAATYSQLSNDILADIARRIAKTDVMTPATEWQLQKMAEMNMISSDTVKHLSKTTGKSERQIKKLLRKSGVDALAYDDKVYRAAGLTPTAIAASPALQGIILQGADNVLAVIGNYTKSLATTTSKAIGNSLDRAYLQVMSGAFDPNTAIHRAINDLARGGYESIAYPSGHIDRVETVVRRAVTTGVNQTCAKLTLERMYDMECDLVEVSSHAGARPSHSEWQGRIYCINGRRGRYDDFYSATGYGDGDGLCGWNCRHSFFPYFEGLSTRSFEHDPARHTGKTNDEIYEESQRQRQLENAVRKAKQECIVYDAAVQSAENDELRAELRQEYDRAAYKLKQRQDQLDNFVTSKERTRLPERETVAGFGRSQAAKATWGNRRETERRANT